MMDQLKNTRILGFIGLVCLFLGVVSPYFSVSFFGYHYDIQLWGYWEGKVMMILIIANLLFIFKDYVEKYAPQLFHSSIGSKIQNADSKFSVIPTIGVAAFAIWLYWTLDIDREYLQHGLGFWALWAGVVCLIAHSILYKKNTANESVPIYSRPQVNSTQIGQATHTMNSSSQTIDNENVKFCPSCRNKCDINADTCHICYRQF